MKVYRGPSSKPFYDDSHEFVSRITPEQLAEGIKDNAQIRFNVTKDGLERQAVCTAQFEDGDFVPMISGLVERLGRHKQHLTQIATIVKDPTLKNDQKVLRIAGIVNAL